VPQARAPRQDESRGQHQDAGCTLPSSRSVREDAARGSPPKHAPQSRSTKERAPREKAQGLPESAAEQKHVVKTNRPPPPQDDSDDDHHLCSGWMQHRKDVGGDAGFCGTQLRRWPMDEDNAKLDVVVMPGDFVFQLAFEKKMKKKWAYVRVEAGTGWLDSTLLIEKVPDIATETGSLAPVIPAESQRRRRPTNRRQGYCDSYSSSVLATTKDENEWMPTPTAERSFSSSGMLAPPPLVPLDQGIHIFTFGLETMDNDIVDFCCSYERGGAEAIVPEELLLEGLRRQGVGDVHMCIDTRIFHDPAAVGKLTKHTGVHPETLHRITLMKRFPDFVKRLRREVPYHLKNVGQVKIAMYCRTGRHRSVACATFLKHFAHAEQWNCKVTHLSQKKWNKICKGECAECMPCGTQESMRREAFAKALSLWRREGRF